MRDLPMDSSLVLFVFLFVRDGQDVVGFAIMITNLGLSVVRCFDGDEKTWPDDETTFLCKASFLRRTDRGNVREVLG